MTLVSWKEAADALDSIIPGAGGMWGPDRVGSVAEDLGIQVRWKKIDGIYSLLHYQLMRILIAEAPALSGELIVVTHSSLLGGQPFKVPVPQLIDFVRGDASPHIADGDLFIIAPLSRVVVLCQAE